MRDVYDSVIIGAGCAGMTCAMYLASAGKKALIIESEGIGGQIAQTPRIDNFPAVRGISGAEFSDRLCKAAEESGAELEFDEVIGIRDGDIKTVAAKYGEFKARTVVIASGVKPRKLGLANEDELIGRGVSYCAMCDGAFYRDCDVCVVGGGSTAFTDALFLADICRRVFIIHHSQSFRAEAGLIKSVRAIENVSIISDTEVTELTGADSLSGVKIRNVITGAEDELAVSAVFAAIGREPSNGIFADVVSLSPDGFIAAGEDCKTSADGIFAAGDCRVNTVRLLLPAAAEGAAAADAVIKYIRK